MKRRKTVERVTAVIAGCIIVLLGACSSIQEPETAPPPPLPATEPSPAPAALEQTAPSAGPVAPAAEREEEVVVSGSRVRRDDFSAPDATTVIDAEDLRKLGAISVADIVNQLPDGIATPSPEAGAASEYDVGASSANLRGLNTFFGDRALTLANDRRMVSTTNGAATVTGGAAAGSPFIRAEPGEEIWIIARFAGDTQAPADDASPGTGAMLATVVPDESFPDRAPVQVPMPLKHTDVHASIVGYVGTVDVKQQFENPFDEKIEADYVFPLPEKAAVSDFVMTIGERHIRGILREKEQAEAIYRQARAQGYNASLLVQHRPNIFEQKVANIEPGKAIDVDIRYFHTLAYRDGWYSFVFPTVVGPRYNPPGSADPVAALPRTDVSPAGQGTAVRYLRPNERSGHDIGITVDIDAGVAIEEVDSTHVIESRRTSKDAMTVALADQATIPNRDFVLNFRVAGGRVKSNLLTYTDPDTGQGYFTMMIYPPQRLERLERQPMEMVFVLDCSGSMSGQPIAQAKAAILEALDLLEPDDTFQIIRFSNNASQLGPRPLAASAENIAMAKQYVQNLSGSGGTQMIEGIRAALDFAHDPKRLRFVTFLTDGYIGNEADIVGAIHDKLGASRIFSFGVGSSVNRFLLERMASEGRGAVAYLGLNDSGSDIMQFFFERISHPALANLQIDWGRMRVSDVYPSRLPDLFVGRPVVVTGKYSGTVDEPVVAGMAGGRDVDFTVGGDNEAEGHEFLPKIWARLRIADLVDRRASQNDPYGELAVEIRDTALAHGLMSDYTAFVAVDASERTAGERGTTVFQAVPVPQGVRYSTTVNE